MNGTINLYYRELVETALATPELFRDLVEQMDAGVDAGGLVGRLETAWSIKVSGSTAARVLESLAIEDDLAHNMLSQLANELPFLARVRWRN